MTDRGYTQEELLIARMAREFRGVGEILGSGATLLSELAVRLGKALYEPDLVIVGGSRGAVDCDIHERTLNDEWVTTATARMTLQWHPELFDIVRHGKSLIWIGPVQIDKHGNSNISVVGSWAKPTIQLVGSRGLPDNNWGVKRMLYHVRRQSARSFVDKVDFVSAAGFGAERARLNATIGKPGLVVSDLGVYDWDEATGLMRIQSLHPDVSIKDVQAKTGFAFANAGDSLPTTAPPTAEELDWIRVRIDPRGLRRIEARDAPESLMGKLLVEESEALAVRLAKTPA